MNAQRPASIERKTIVVQAPGGDPLEYIMSDETVDRLGDVIQSDGWQLSSFRQNPIGLFGHNSGFIVGRWDDVRVQNKQLRGRLELLEPVSERMREVHAAVAAGVLRAVSVGFRAIEHEPLDPKSKDPWGPIRFIRQELVECSLVSVPANPNALAVAKGLNLSRETMGLIFGESARGDRSAVHRVIRGASADPPNLRRTPSMNTISDRIEQAQARVNLLRDQQAAHLAKFDDDDMDEEALVAAEEFNNRISTELRKLEMLKSAETTTATRSEPVNGNGNLPAIVNRPRPFAMPKKKDQEPKEFIYRALTVGLLARIQQRSKGEILQERYGDDEVTRIIADHLVTRSASVPATMTLTGWAAELTHTIIADFLEALMPDSIYPGLSARGPRFTFGTANQINIPGRNLAPSLAGSFVAEGAPIPVRQGAFSAISLTPKKMGVISTFTREIAEHSTPQIEQIIRQAIQDDTAIAIDTVLLDANAATTIRPAGLKNGVSASTAATGGGFNAVVGDVKTLLSVLTAANSLRSPTWIMNPVTAASLALTTNPLGQFPFESVGQGESTGTLIGYPVLKSTTVVAKDLFLVDGADFASVTGDEPRFDVSDQAVLHMEDTSPAPISAVGTPNTVAAPLRSLWQTDSIGIRMVLPMNWAMRRTGLVAWMANVTWG